MDPRLLLLSGIVLFAYLIGATTGFGSAVIALTLAVNFFPIDFLIPVIIPLNIITCAYLVLRHRSEVDMHVLLRRILPLVGIGLFIGLIVFNTVDTAKLKRMFGAFVLFVSLFELFRLLRSNGASPASASSARGAGLWLLAGGIAQGIWVSGGPMVAYWAGRNLLSKEVFRSTLTCLFLILNLVLFVSHLSTGGINADTAWASFLLMPFMAVGIALGEWLHVKLPERSFRIFVFVILVFAGASIAVRG